MENNNLINDSQMQNSPLSAEEERLLEAALTDSINNSTGEPIEESIEEPANEVHNNIPVNSSIITINRATSRFSGAVWYDKMKELSVLLVGAGGIGSHLALLLGRFYVDKLEIYDPDVVEEANMAGQLYSQDSIGLYKAGEIASTIIEYCPSTGNRVHTFIQNYRLSSTANNITIGAVDNMSTRKTIFANWLSLVVDAPAESRHEYLLLDGRLSPEEFQVFAIQGDDDFSINEYRTKWLFSDEEAETTSCSYKQTTYMASMIASVMANVLANFATNLCNPPVERPVPFLTQYDATTMFMKSQL